MLEATVAFKGGVDCPVRRVSGIVSSVRPSFLKVCKPSGEHVTILYGEITHCQFYDPWCERTHNVDSRDVRAFLTQWFEENTNMYPTSNPNTPSIPASGPDRIAAMEAALAAEVEKQKHAAVTKAKRDSVAEDLSFVNAQAKLLGCIDAMLKGTVLYTAPMAELAEHHKALKPLAEKHGYKVVLIGDKSTATIVAI